MSSLDPRLSKLGGSFQMRGRNFHRVTGELGAEVVLEPGIGLPSALLLDPASSPSCFSQALSWFGVCSTFISVRLSDMLQGSESCLSCFFMGDRDGD